MTVSQEDGLSEHVKSPQFTSTASADDGIIPDGVFTDEEWARTHMAQSDDHAQQDMSAAGQAASGTADKSLGKRSFDEMASSFPEARPPNPRSYAHDDTPASSLDGFPRNHSRFQHANRDVEGSPAGEWQRRAGSQVTSSGALRNAAVTRAPDSELPRRRTLPWQRTPVTSSPNQPPHTTTPPSSAPLQISSQQRTATKDGPALAAESIHTSLGPSPISPDPTDIGQAETDELLSRKSKASWLRRRSSQVEESQDGQDKLEQAAYWRGVADGQSGEVRSEDGPEELLHASSRRRSQPGEPSKRGLWDIGSGGLIRQRRQDPSRHLDIYTVPNMSQLDHDRTVRDGLKTEDWALRGVVQGLHTTYLSNATCRNAWSWKLPKMTKQAVTDADEQLDMLATRTYGYLDEIHGHLRVTHAMQNPVVPCFVADAPYSERVEIVKRLQATVRKAATALERSYKEGKTCKGGLMKKENSWTKVEDSDEADGDGLDLEKMN